MTQNEDGTVGLCPRLVNKLVDGSCNFVYKSGMFFAITGRYDEKKLFKRKNT